MKNSVETSGERNKRWMIIIGCVIGGVLGLAVLACFRYPMLVHEIFKASVASLIMAISLSIGIIGYSAYATKEPKSSWLEWPGIKSIAASLFYGFGFFFIFYGVVLCAKGVLTVLWVNTASIWLFSWLAGIATLVVGGVFFCMRLKWRATYGFTEVTAGIYFAFYRAFVEKGNVPESLEFYFAVLAGGIYLVVRGLDNIHQGKSVEKDPLVRFASRIKKKVKAAGSGNVKQALDE